MRVSNASNIIKAVLVLIIATEVAIGSYAFFHSSPAAANSVSSNSCEDKILSLGSSGACVSDAQAMVDYLETDNLTQCSFKGANPVSINGSYNSATQAQVKVVQSWFDCYSAQEGLTSAIQASGTMDSPTWTQLCIYAYQYPSQSGQSSSSYLKQSLDAGKDAGC